MPTVAIESESLEANGRISGAKHEKVRKFREGVGLTESGWRSSRIWVS